MNPQQPLPLRDIHLPDPVSWWPPAIGWWILLALLILLAVLLPALIRRLRKKSLKKFIVQEFDAIVDAHQNNPTALLQATSAFLRQLLMTYRGRKNIAGLTGDQWLGELQNISPEKLPQPIIFLLKDGPYQKSVNFNEEQFIHDLRQWLKQLPQKVGGQAGGQT